jgi:RNA ligase (TIGR02306 family)
MSEWKVIVTKLGKIGKHPNADNLSISQVCGSYPVIFRTGDYQEGDLVVHVPIDSIVPDEDPRWEFLGDQRRIKAKKLRGIFSMGLLTPANPEWEVGQDVGHLLGITKYIPPEPLSLGGDNEHCPFYFPEYTDLEGYRRYPNVLIPGEDVVLLEKVHGTNGRWVYRDGRLWVGSHHHVKKHNPDSAWWKAAAQSHLEAKLANHPNIALYGEVYGDVQDLKYGLRNKNEIATLFFDAMDLNSLRYLDFVEFFDLMFSLELPICPVLYRGPWSEDLLKYGEGISIVRGASNVREGFVVRPTKERFDGEIGRVLLKYVGEGYLLRKGG